MILRVAGSSPVFHPLKSIGNKQLTVDNPYRKIPALAGFFVSYRLVRRNLTIGTAVDVPPFSNRSTRLCLFDLMPKL